MRARPADEDGVATRHKSAVKAHRQTLKRTDHNRELRSKLRTGLKAIRAAIDGGDSAQAKSLLNETISLIDKMAGKGVIHDNAAGRYKSRLVKRLQTAKS
jgi:small subunit ribosomal protein S20